MLELELNQSYKYQVLDSPIALPNKCVGCGLDHNLNGTVKFIDTGQELDFYGVIYICTRCFVEMAESLGFPDPEKWLNAVAIIKENETYIAKLEGENEGLRAAVNTLTGHQCRVPIPSALDLENEPRVKVDETNDGDVSSGESESPEPDPLNSEPGFRDVRRSAKLKPASKPTVNPDDPLAEFDL